MSMRIDTYLPALSPGCCVAKIYALVFAPNHQALKDPGTTVRVLTNYTKATHSTFAILLNEHPERTKYYYLDLDTAQFVLAANVAGEPYYMEFWRRDLAGTFNRDQDILEETRQFYWSGTQFIESQLDATQENSLAQYHAHVTPAYDSENQIVYLTAFLDRNGALVTDSLQFELLWLDTAGATIYNGTTSTFLANAPGVFAMSLPGIDLVPDRVGTMIARITDADSVVHSTVSTSIHWD